MCHYDRTPFIFGCGSQYRRIATEPNPQNSSPWKTSLWVNIKGLWYHVPAMPARQYPQLVVPGSGDEVFVFLGVSLEAQEVVVAAAAGAWKLTADFGPALVNCASTGLTVQETAHRAEVLVALVAEHAFVLLVAGLGVLRPRLLDADPMVLGEAGNISLADDDSGIGATVGGTFPAVIENQFFLHRRKLAGPPAAVQEKAGRQARKNGLAPSAGYFGLIMSAKRGDILLLSRRSS